MYSKVQRFQELTTLKTEKINELCALLHRESDLENDMILNYLEFSDDSNVEAELLILEIANELLGGKLSELKQQNVFIQAEIDNIRQKLYELI